MFFGATAVLTLLLVTEQRNPVRNLASLTVPGWTVFEDHLPTRALLIVVFSLAVLAAWALDRPLATMRLVPYLVALEGAAILVLIGGVSWQPAADQMPVVHMQLRFLAALLALYILVLAAWRVTRLRLYASRLAVPSLVAILIADLALHNHSLHIQYDTLPDSLFGPSPAAQFISGQATTPARYATKLRPGTDWNSYLDPRKASTLLSGGAGLVYGLDDVQAYNPIQLNRYREFLAAVNGQIDVEYHYALILNPLSPLLKYLNVKFLVSDPAESQAVELVNAIQLNAERPEVSVPTSTNAVRGLIVDSGLGNAGSVPQGSPVAAVDVVAADGSSTRLTLRAGVETAEWAYDSPDVLPSVQHQRPVIARNVPGGADFQGHSYRAAFSFAHPTAIKELHFELLAPQIVWAIDQVTSDSESLLDSYRTVYEANGVRILQADEFLPRAYLTHSVEQLSDGPSILARLQDANFDPHQAVVVEEPPSPSDANLGQPLIANGQWSASSTPTDPRESADLQASDSNSLSVHVHAQQAGMLMLSEVFYPAWRAYVDGQPAHIYRADYLFRAIAVPAGDHAVELRYESATFQRGLLISLVSLGVLMLAGCGLWIRQRRKWAKQL
jgi:hypothetical protein